MNDFPCMPCVPRGADDRTMVEVVLYSRQGCPFCETVETLLVKECLPFKKVELDEVSRKMLAALTDEIPEQLTVPKIMIGDRLIRTSDEFLELKATSALTHLVGSGGFTRSVSASRQALPDVKGAICVLHTGPTDKIWLSELERALTSLGAKVTYVDVEKLGACDLSQKLPYSVVVNRVSDAVDPPLARFLTSLLSLAATQDVPVVNGAVPQSIATSKLAQHSFFHAAGLRTPQSFAVRCVGDVDDAFKKLGGTVIMKPNAGSFGKGIKKFSDPLQLHDHAQNASAYGNDGVAIIQQYHDVKEVYRVFILDGEVQCAVKTAIDKDREFTAQCMASAQKRRTTEGASAVTPIEVPAEVKRGCIDAMARSGANVGSIEYLIDPSSGEALYFDLNLLSTYPDVAVAGRDCWIDLAKSILSKARPA